MSMFKGKEVVTMPKDIKVPLPSKEPEDRELMYAPPREQDIDAEGNFLNAHRRLKAELAEAKKLANDACVELKARQKIIERLEVDLVKVKDDEQFARAERDQAVADCAALENLFQNIAAMTDRYLHPREIKREQNENQMLEAIKATVQEIKHDERGD